MERRHNKELLFFILVIKIN
uniref:Uncharacterized protein n=1 Tax=Anguilla anguilla TaxID=7936 RepID=A0A0E9SZR2_ANGAN